MTTDDRLLSGASSLHPNKSSGDIVERLIHRARSYSRSQRSSIRTRAPLDQDMAIHQARAAIQVMRERVLHEYAYICSSCDIHVVDVDDFFERALNSLRDPT